MLVAVGERWAATGEGVEVEHLLADCVAAVAARDGGRRARAAGRRPVLLACAPDEQHALPLHALAAGLAERGIGVRTLGPAMPADALVAAVRRTGPAALFVWSQLPGTADPRCSTALPVTRPADRRRSSAVRAGRPTGCRAGHGRRRPAARGRARGARPRRLTRGGAGAR